MIQNIQLLNTIAHMMLLILLAIFSYGISFEKTLLATWGLEPASPVSVNSIGIHWVFGWGRAE